jgi:hypothetical protein
MPHARRSHLLAWIVILAFVVGGAWWLWATAPSGGKFGSETVKVYLTGPSVLKAGERGTWRAQWTNAGSLLLRNVEVRLEPTSAFVLGDVRPSVVDPASGHWAVADVPSGETASLEFDGVFWEKPGLSNELVVAIAFTPEQFGARFERQARLRVTTVESTLRVSLDGPTQIIGSGERTYTILIENSGLEPVGGVKLVVSPPPSFVVSKTDPEMVRSDSTFVGTGLTIPAGEKEEFRFSGSYLDQGDSPVGGKSEWKADVFVRPALASTDMLQGTAALAVVGVSGGALLTVVIGGSAENRSVPLGERLAIAVRLTNQGKEALEDVVLTVAVTPVEAAAVSLLDWERARLSRGDRSESTITFSPEVMPSLARIAPRENVELRVDVPIQETLDPTLISLGNIAFDVSATAAVGKTAGVVEPRQLRSNLIRVELNSDATARSTARYFSDENLALGSGPLPPRVGHRTSIRVFWKVTNSLHELAGLTISARLPSDVLWTGNARVSAGTIRFDAPSREIRWTVNRMPTTVASLDADFELAFEPTERDLGQSFLLLKGTEFEAEDTITHARLSTQLKNLDSNLAGDPFGAGKGVVAR